MRCTRMRSWSGLKAIVVLSVFCELGWMRYVLMLAGAYECWQSTAL